MFSAAFLGGIVTKVLALITTAVLGVSTAGLAGAVPGLAGTAKHVTAPASATTGAKADGSAATPAGEVHASVGATTSKNAGSVVPDAGGLSSALSGLGSGLVSCVTSALPTTGSLSSVNQSQLASEVGSCVTNKLGAFKLPAGSGACSTAIMSAVDSALAGKVPSFNYQACIPAASAGSGTALGSSDTGTAGLSSALSGLGSGLAGCVTSNLPSGAGISSVNQSQLASEVGSCVTSQLGTLKLPAGSGACSTAIMSAVDSALAGKVPSFNPSACIPAGTTGLSGLSGTSSLSATSGLSGLSGFSQLFGQLLGHAAGTAGQATSGFGGF